MLFPRDSVFQAPLEGFFSSQFPPSEMVSIYENGPYSHKFTNVYIFRLPLEYYKDGYKLYLNTGWSSSLNSYKRRLLTQEADLVTTHGMFTKHYEIRSRKIGHFD